MQGAYVLVGSDKADLDVSRWAQERTKLFGIGRPEAISPILTTTLLVRQLLQEVCTPLPDLWVPVHCSGNAQHLGDVLPKPKASVRRPVTSGKQAVTGKGTINLTLFSLSYVNSKLHESNCYNWLKLASKLMTLKQCCKQLTH